MRVVGIGNAKSDQIMEEVKVQMLVVDMLIMGLVVIEMKVMLTNIENAPRGRTGLAWWGGIGNAKSDQIIEEVGGGEKKISRQWFSALRRLAS